MKKINLARIIQRLTEKFDLTEYQAEPLLFSETVVPTSDVDELLKAYKLVGAGNYNISAGNATIYTCPVNKRARIIYAFKGTTAGSTSFRFTDTSESSQVIDFLTGTTSTASGQLGFVLDPGDTIVYLQGAAGDTSVAARLFISEEDAY